MRVVDVLVASALVLGAPAVRAEAVAAPAAAPLPTVETATPSKGTVVAAPVETKPSTGPIPTPGPAGEVVVPAVPCPTCAVPDVDEEEVAADDSDDDGEGPDDDDAGGADEGVDEEAESHETTGGVALGPRYSADLDDAELARRWKHELASLGSLSVGFSDAGRLINGERFPTGENWIVVDPANCFATRETIEYVRAAIDAVVAEFPDAPRIRVNHISRKDGGWLRPHKSHQNGRDVDLGFYYPTEDPIRVRNREKVIALDKNWALVKALITRTDVQMILVDKRIIQALYAYALEKGEDKAWLDDVFRSGANALVKHARRHRDHFHVRFWNPRAQELGRRVQPLLAQQPEYNVVAHRVRRGDTLGHIARKYGTTIVALRKVNRMRNSFLSIGRVLTVPLRGPCTHCPVPPEVVVPPRRLPPASTQAAAPDEVQPPVRALK